MRNAHERFGILEFTKRMKDTTTHIRLPALDTAGFVGEIGRRNGRRFTLLSGSPVVGILRRGRHLGSYQGRELLHGPGPGDWNL